MNRFFLPVLLSLSLGVTNSYAQEDPKTAKKEEKKIQRDEQGDLGKKADKKEAKMYKKEDKMDQAADHNNHRKAARQKGKLIKKDEKNDQKGNGRKIALADFCHLILAKTALPIHMLIRLKTKNPSSSEDGFFKCPRLEQYRTN